MRTPSFNKTKELTYLLYVNSFVSYLFEFYLKKS